MSIKFKQLKKIKQNAWKTDAKRTDQTIKYCKGCKQCFEKLEGQTWNHYDFKYLVDFPSYKKPRELCPQCKKESVNDNV